MEPYILDQTDNYAVVFKPPRMHSISNKKGLNGSIAAHDTLFDWYTALYPLLMDCGGGLLHRLDYETQGLMLFAKNKRSLDYLLSLQEQGKFIKEYYAVCCKAAVDSSFPPSPVSAESLQKNCIIESYFRPYGPGRKQVRPVMKADHKKWEIAQDRGNYYRTEVINIEKSAENGQIGLTLNLKRGFRHQIRCHLAWTGCPVLNDPLYGEKTGDEYLALKSTGLIFNDPENNKLKEYHL